MKRIFKVIYSVYKNKFVNWFVIPLTLLLFWIVSSVLFSTYSSLTSITYSHDNSSITRSPQGSMLQGDVIEGELTAKENNFGIISLRFNKLKIVETDEEDVIVFRIKEKSGEEWLYENIYKSNGFYNSPLYPFGFPAIHDSKGKQYVFSILSLNGNEKNNISINSQDADIKTKYVFTKQEILSSNENFLNFITQKFITSFTDIDFLLSSIIFLIPFVVYLLWNFIFTQKLKTKYFFIVAMPLFILFLTVLGIDLIDGIFYGIIIIWILTVREFQISSTFSFSIAAFYFLVSLILFMFGNFDMGARTSNWLYIFLFIGSIQLILENKILPKKRKR